MVRAAASWRLSLQDYHTLLCDDQLRTRDGGTVLHEVFPETHQDLKSFRSSTIIPNILDGSSTPARALLFFHMNVYTAEIFVKNFGVH